MTITALQKKGSNVLIIFDSGDPVTLDYRTVLDNGLRKNDSLNDETLGRLINESCFLKIKDSAFRLLGRRHHSVFELKKKLLTKKFPAEIIHSALNDLTEKKFLDDAQFAAEYVEERSHRKKIGINKLRAELFKKGISREIIESVLLNVDGDLSLRQAAELAAKKYKSLQHKTSDRKKLKGKIYSFLSSRGFESEVIVKVLNDFDFGDD